MATKLIDKGNAIYEVTTSVNGDFWKDAQKKALNKLALNVEVKGFRKGKAPLNLAKERISQGQIYQEAMDIVLPKMYSDVVVEHKLKPYYRPDVNPTKVSETEFEAKFTIICVPEVTLGKYKGIKVPLAKVSVTKDEIKHAIEHVCEENAEWVLKETEAAMGDTVVMDFKGYVDGKEFEGGNADNYSLVLGSNQFIPGFEEQLVGAKPENKIDVNVTFPEQYVKELAGKKAKFACKIHEVKSKKVPEVSDDFAKGLNLDGVNDIASLEKYEENNILNGKKQNAKNEQFAKILEEITKDSKVVIAPQVIESEAENVKNNMVQQITQNGLSYEQYKEITGLNDDQLAEQFKKEAEARLTQFLVINKIAEVEKLIISKEEIASYYQNLANQYKMKLDEVEKALKPQEDRLVSQLLQTKIENFIIANNGDLEEEKKTTAKKTENKTEK